MTDGVKETKKRRATGKPFQKGNKLAGSRKGVPNKINAEFKQAIIDSFHNRGGVAFLDSLDPALFTSLMRSVIPKEMAQDITISGSLTFEQIIDRLNSEK